MKIEIMTDEMVFCYLNGKSLMTRVTDVAIESVVMSCKHLTALNVSGCKVCGNPPCLLAHVNFKSSCFCLHLHA